MNESSREQPSESNGTLRNITQLGPHPCKQGRIPSAGPSSPDLRPGQLESPQNGGSRASPDDFSSNCEVIMMQITDGMDQFNKEAILSVNGAVLEPDRYREYFMNGPLAGASNIYGCFRGCNKYSAGLSKTSSTGEMEPFCSQIDKEKVREEKMREEKPRYDFDSNTETVLFVSESIRNRGSIASLAERSRRHACKASPRPGIARKERHARRITRADVKAAIDNIAYTPGEIEARLGLKTIPFSEMPPNPTKIGEASFSEVFMTDGLVYKIIPFTQWYTFESFCKEAFILDMLKEEPGVCRLADRFLVKGGYTEEYLRAWERYSGGLNARPADLGSEQVSGVLVMEDCGRELEKYEFESFAEVVEFTEQLISIICRLEEKYKFEHRDMHWGNIMVKDGEVRLIDLSFARIEDGKVAYTDLETQEWLFEGDAKEDMQFEIYVEERKVCKGEWMRFHAKTNMLWMRYVLRKLELKVATLGDGDAKKQLARIILKAYEFGDCGGFKAWLEGFVSRHQLIKC